MADLNLIVLRVNDIEASARFYAALGITFKTERHGSGPIHLSGPSGQVVLELYPAAGKDSCSKAVRLGFSVLSLESLLPSMIEGGGTIVSRPKAGLWGLRAVISDPDGNHVEVVERSL